MNVVEAANRPAVEHRYFVRAAVAIAAIVVAGFVPNYTLRLLHDDRYLTWTVHLHGLLLASWIGLFVVQARLVASRRLDLHRRLGILGAALVAPILIVGLVVLLNAVVRRAPAADLAPTPVNYCLLAVAFDGLNLLLFAGLATYAILVRRRTDYHKRLMLLAGLSVLGPAFGRLTSYASGFRGDNNLAVLLLMLACPAVCVVLDVRRQRRWHPVFIWGTALLVAADVLTYVAKVSL